MVWTHSAGVVEKGRSSSILAGELIKSSPICWSNSFLRGDPDASINFFKAHSSWLKSPVKYPSYDEAHNAKKVDVEHESKTQGKYMQVHREGR